MNLITIREFGFFSTSTLNATDMIHKSFHNEALEHSHPVMYLLSTLALQKVTFSILPINFIKHLSSHSLFYTTLY
jgi:hypothetical protein